MIFIKRMASTSSIQAALKAVSENVQNAVSKRTQVLIIFVISYICQHYRPWL